MCKDKIRYQKFRGGKKFLLSIVSFFDCPINVESLSCVKAESENFSYPNVSFGVNRTFHSMQFQPLPIQLLSILTYCSFKHFRHELILAMDPNYWFYNQEQASCKESLQLAAYWHPNYFHWHALHVLRTDNPISLHQIPVSVRAVLI